MLSDFFFFKNIPRSQYPTYDNLLSTPRLGYY